MLRISTIQKKSPRFLQPDVAWSRRPRPSLLALVFSYIFSSSSIQIGLDALLELIITLIPQ